jgi:hypothetical protein
MSIGTRDDAGTSTRGLTREQLGHIRRIQGLAALPTNDWSGMQNRSTGQDDFGGYRFQLAYGAYALALAYKHRLPNAPGVFQPTFARLIEKILLPEVWMYWRDTSRGGSIFNAHLSHQYEEEWDPVARNNIMYSAYVMSMATMYDVLFDDDRFTQPESLSFDHWSYFWGGEPKHAPYDQNSLTEHLYWKMVEGGYIGIACEPNCIFQICNQPAILGFRMHDLKTGAGLADDVVAGYQRAWADYGRLDANGHYNMMLLEDSKTAVPNQLLAPWVDAWCGSLMNMWNRDFVHARYPRQVKDFVQPGPHGTLTVPISPPMEAMGQLVTADTCNFGWVAAWASEMGDTDTLGGLLRYADEYLNPQWQDGALFYPRNDVATDAQGNPTVMEPQTGNILLGYARLNVPDGLWSLYNQPWDAAHFTEPLVTTVDDAVDITVASFDREAGELTVRAGQRAGRQPAGEFTVTNVTPRTQVFADGERIPVSPIDGVLHVKCVDDAPHAYTITAPDWTLS